MSKNAVMHRNADNPEPSELFVSHADVEMDDPACPSCDENGCIDDARCPEWGKTYAQAAACVPVIAGTSGSGKSLSLAQMAERFTRKHPDSPVRILDVGRSAGSLADLWR